MGLGIALGGLLVGHWSSYRMVAGSHGELQQLLGHGHGYLTWAVRIAVIISFCSAFRAFQKPQASTKLSLLQRWLVLGGSQSIFFVVLEVLERIAVGAPLTDVPRILTIGIPLQLVVALGAALLVKGIQKLGCLAVVTPPPDRARPKHQFAHELGHVSGSCFGSISLRGPPLVRFI